MSAPGGRLTDGPADLSAGPELGGWVPSDLSGDDAAAPAQGSAVASAARAAPSVVERRARWHAAIADRLPVALRGATVHASGRAVVGLGLLLLAAAVLVVVLTWLTRPETTTVPAVRRSVPGGSSSPAGAAAPAAGAPGAVPSDAASASPTALAARLFVHVAGAVRRPGLVELPSGSRVADAIAAAGGATGRANVASVNLARLVVDGEQILVLRKGQAGPPAAAVTGGGGPPPGTGTAGAAPQAPLDLNTATAQQLDGLPGVGPVLAQRIIDFRTENGRFTSVDELNEVSGIGERTLEDLRPLVRV